MNSPIAGVDLNVDQLGMTTHGSLYNAHNTQGSGFLYQDSRDIELMAQGQGLMFQKKSKLSDLDTAKASKEILSPEKGSDKLDELKEREQRIS